jgi:2-keto-4-pentenoate hydratase
LVDKYAVATGKEFTQGDLVIAGSVTEGIEISTDSNYEAVSCNMGNVSVGFIKESKQLILF